MSRNNRVIKLILIPFVIGIALFLSSCNHQNEEVPSMSPLPTMTKNTSLPTPGATTTATPIIQTSTPGNTHLPTLEDSKVEAYLTDLIQNPKNCLLPCWWGLTPGVSSWQDVLDFMFHIGHEKLYVTGNYDEYENLDFNDLRLYQVLTVNQQSNIVSQITFEVEGIYNPGGFNTIWHSYSPEQMLARYGKPSRVTIYYSLVNAGAPGTNNKIGYILRLYYDKDGFFVWYEGLGTYQKYMIHVCPQFNADNSWTVRFYLQDPKLSTPLEQMVDGYQIFLDNTYSLEDATGLSIDQFMGLSQGKLTCFDIHIK